MYKEQLQQLKELMEEGWMWTINNRIDYQFSVSCWRERDPGNTAALNFESYASNDMDLNEAVNKLYLLVHQGDL